MAAGYWSPEVGQTGGNDGAQITGSVHTDLHPRPPAEAELEPQKMPELLPFYVPWGGAVQRTGGLCTKGQGPLSTGNWRTFEGNERSVTLAGNEGPAEWDWG